MSCTLVLPDGRRIEVTERIVLGRVEADVSVDDEEVSRLHAAVQPFGEALEVEDLDSRNGTFVNGARVSRPTRLAPGDELRLGRVAVSVEGFAAATVVSAGEAPPPFSPPVARRQRAAATRLPAPLVLTYVAVAATALALVLYFALR